VFTDDGSLALWLSWSEGEQVALSALDLRRPGALPFRSGVSYRDRPLTFAVAPDGSRVAALWRDRVTVDDLRTGRMLVSQSLPGDPSFDVQLRFTDPGRIRLYRGAETQKPVEEMDWRFTSLDLEIATRRITPGPVIETAPGRWYFEVSPDGDHALLHRYTDCEDCETLLADLRTGHTRKLLTPRGRPHIAEFLADGRLILAETGRQEITLRLLAPDATDQLSTVLPGFHLRIGGQITPDLLAVATAPGGSRSIKEYTEWSSWLVDLRTGKVRAIEKGLLPTAMGPRQPGSLPSRLFFRGHGDLHLLDPSTGTLRTVLPGAGPAQVSPLYPWTPLVVQNFGG
jgi:hypothetical protein